MLQKLPAQAGIMADSHAHGQELVAHWATIMAALSAEDQPGLTQAALQWACYLCIFMPHSGLPCQMNTGHIAPPQAKRRLACVGSW